MASRLLKIFVLGFILAVVCVSAEASFFNRQPNITVRVFYSPTCKACHKVMQDVIPPIEEKYGSKVNWEYFDVTSEEGLRSFVALESKSDRRLAYPTILVGENILIGVTEAADSLDTFIAAELAKADSAAISIESSGVDLLERFRSFGPLAIIGAGLVDGFNPCAFTVIVFFVSFLTVMGYRRREMTIIGSFYILAVFLTYLGLGLGLFSAFYTFKGFYVVSKIIYLVIGGISIFLGALAIKDYVIYKKTGNTDAMALQLPRAIKNRIHSIVGQYYRKDKSGQKKELLGLILSALLVGFMISILEAVCTGQLYLPTIVFVLKEGSLRARAFFYLIVYNLMFVFPLVIVLLAALGGVSSLQFEAYARKNLGLIKLLMAAVFLALGFVLLVGI